MKKEVHFASLKIRNYSRIFVCIIMFKRGLIIFSILAIVAFTMEGCFNKNKCDGCPGLVKKKKVRRSSKGSI